MRQRGCSLALSAIRACQNGDDPSSFDFNDGGEIFHCLDNICLFQRGQTLRSQRSVHKGAQLTSWALSRHWLTWAGTLHTAQPFLWSTLSAGRATGLRRLTQRLTSFSPGRRTPGKDRRPLTLRTRKAESVTAWHAARLREHPVAPGARQQLRQGEHSRLLFLREADILHCPR